MQRFLCKNAGNILAEDKAGGRFGRIMAQNLEVHIDFTMYPENCHILGIYKIIN